VAARERTGERPHDPVDQLEAVHVFGVAPSGIHDLVLAALHREAAPTIEAVDALAGATRHTPEDRRAA